MYLLQALSNVSANALPKYAAHKWQPATGVTQTPLLTLASTLKTRAAHSRRITAVQLGAVAPLTAMVAYAPRMPPPALVPAPPPPALKGKKKSSAVKKPKPEVRRNGAGGGGGGGEGKAIRGLMVSALCRTLCAHGLGLNVVGRGPVVPGGLRRTRVRGGGKGLGCTAPRQHAHTGAGCKLGMCDRAPS